MTPLSDFLPSPFTSFLCNFPFTVVKVYGIINCQREIQRCRRIVLFATEIIFACASLRRGLLLITPKGRTVQHLV